MSENQPPAYKRGFILSTIVFIIFFSIAATAKPAYVTEINTHNIAMQLDTINHDVLDKSNSYTHLAQILSDIKLLQNQLTLCINTGTARLKKIILLLNPLPSPMTSVHDSESYNYLINEKNKESVRLETCNFLNFKLDEIRDIATDQIDKVDKLKLLKKTPMWDKVNLDLFFNLHFSTGSIVQHSGLEQFNKTQYSVLALIFGLSLCVVFFLRKKNMGNTGTVHNICRDYLLYLLPLSLICLYLNYIFMHSYPAPISILTINAITLYTLSLFIIKLFLAVGMGERSCTKALTAFQITILISSIMYTSSIQFLFLHNSHIPLSYLNLIQITYFVIIVRLLIACWIGFKQWLTERLVVTILNRTFKIATMSILGYIIYVILSTQPLPSVFFALVDTLYITLLNLAYFWLISPFINNLMTGNYRRISMIALKSICLLNIIAAWFGYHYLAIMFVPNLLVTTFIVIVLRDVNQLIKTLHFRLNNPSQVWSQKLHYSLGLKPESKLIELYFILALINIPIIAVGILSAMEVWGATRYQVLTLLDSMHSNFTLFGTKADSVQIFKAIFMFCIIILFGRVLATSLLRTTLVREEKRTKMLILSTVQYISYAAGILVALHIAGLNLKNLVVIAGALSVGLGFGLQTFVKDLVCGLIIIINKPIMVGDHIELGDRNINEGFITKIGALSTQLHTLSLSDVIIPNSEIITKVITNFTFQNNKLSRINITVPVDKNTDFNSARQLLLEIATKNPNVLHETPYEPIVLFELYDMNLWCVIKDINNKDSIISDLNLEIANAFKDLPNQTLEPVDN